MSRTAAILGEYNCSYVSVRGAPPNAVACHGDTFDHALRDGYLVAPWPLMGHILPLKTDADSGALEQMVLAEFLPGNFDTHVISLLPMLRKSRNPLRVH